MPAILKRRRAGTNLIELVVVISLQTLLMGTAVGLIGRLLEAEQVGRADLEALMSLDSLAEQFRRDVNAASAASILADNAATRGLDVELSEDRRATYEIHSDRVVRFEKRGDEVMHREAYRLPRQGSVTFQELSEGPRRMLRMEVFAPAAASSTPNMPRLTCDAVLGRDVVNSLRRIDGAPDSEPLSRLLPGHHSFPSPSTRGASRLHPQGASNDAS